MARSMGASSHQNARSWMDAAISAPNPLVFGASWTMTQRPVFLTESMTVSRSHGTRVWRSIRSHETPDCSMARCATWTMAPHAMTVQPSPSRTVSACSRSIR